jgi:hypothetical protein
MEMVDIGSENKCLIPCDLRFQQQRKCRLLSYGLLHHMVLQTMTNSEDGGNIFLQNIGNHTQY